MILADNHSVSEAYMRHQAAMRLNRSPVSTILSQIMPSLK